MLSHEETMRLLSLAADGDDNATERLIAENTPLLKSIVKRYMGKHIEYDDLFQIAGIGLLKAIKNFKQDFNVRFSTYAVPMILGEIKRQMRDDGYIKVSRSLKSLSSKITRYMDEVIKQGNDDPTVEQIARHFDISPSDVVFALDATRLPLSLYSDKGNLVASSANTTSDGLMSKCRAICSTVGSSLPCLITSSMYLVIFDDRLFSERDTLM